MTHLEARLNNLRRQRVAARRAIERAPFTISDPIDCRRFVEMQVYFLRGTEAEWETLHRLLGKDLPGPPVKLQPRPREVAALKRQEATRPALPVVRIAPARTAAPARRSVDLTGSTYLTRMIRPSG